MNDMIKFSVVTVCYNASATIEKTMASILGQDYPYFEYIIVDGASTDDTLSIIHRMKDDKVRLFSEPDKGLYDAMNKGLDMATGDYLIFMGADDIFCHQSVLSEVVKKMEGSKDVYYGKIIRTSSQKESGSEFNKWDWGYKNVCHQTIFYSSNVFKKYKYDLQYKLAADWAYNLRLLKNGYQFLYLDYTVSVYNDMTGLSSTYNDDTFLKNYFKLVCSAVGFLPYCYGIVAKIIKRIEK